MEEASQHEDIFIHILRHRFAVDTHLFAFDALFFSCVTLTFWGRLFEAWLALTVG